VNVDSNEAPIGEALAAAFTPSLTVLGFTQPTVAENGVHFDGPKVGFEARYEPRDGELAVYVLPNGTDERIQLLMYLRAIRSPGASELGDAVADSAEAALRHAAIYAGAIPAAASLLAGDPEEIERARRVRWWDAGPTG